jgi:DNA-binding MarR family transcriptional regulator
MTENPLPRPSIGRALGETSRLIKKLHDRATADHGTDFPTWMLLTLLTEKGAALPVEDVEKELDQRMDLAGPDVRRLLERAAAAGHVAYRTGHDPATAELTEAGAAYFAAVYADARAATDVAFHGIDQESLDTALTVLLAAKERAAAALA